ncbi:RDD family protein [Methyloraptor flagellatus]|uniref:RDD family protein n=1 Tax=Methyloraptor flagellatus TaxID=3162530 RepID=A0AAU7XFK5_9HYPH
MSDMTRGQPAWVFDPLDRPELFEGTLSRRVFAYLLDIFFVTLFWLMAGLVVFFLGIATFGLAWAIYPALWPIVGILYVTATLGGANAATPGMGMMGLTMRLWHGGRPDPLIALMHVVLFYAASAVLTPLIHLIGLFTARRQLLQDLILGTVVINARMLDRTIAPPPGR